MHLQLRLVPPPSALYVECAGSCFGRIRQHWWNDWHELADSGFGAPKERKTRRRCAGMMVSLGGFRWMFVPSLGASDGPGEVRFAVVNTVWTFLSRWSYCQAYWSWA